MGTTQIFRRIGQGTIAPSTVVSIELPKVHYLGALEIHMDAVGDVSSGSLTVVDSTHGIIPMITSIQLVLDGRTIPLNISGKHLDWWSRVDRPGSERLALSATADGGLWDAVLRYELAQSIANLTGALPLWHYASARLEITFGAATLAATGTAVTFTGVVDVYGELYDQNRPVVVDPSVVHTLRSFTADITSSGEKRIKIPKGRALERMLVVPENNSAQDWTLLTDVALECGPGDTTYSFTTPVARARQLRHYGGDDIPITGLYIFDFRQAGNRDIVALGDPRVAPEPELVLTVSSDSLTTAKVHIILEELEPVGQPVAMAA